MNLYDTHCLSPLVIKASAPVRSPPLSRYNRSIIRQSISCYDLALGCSLNTVPVKEGGYGYFPAG